MGGWRYEWPGALPPDVYTELVAIMNRALQPTKPKDSDDTIRGD